MVKSDKIVLAVVGGIAALYLVNRTSASVSTAIESVGSGVGSSFAGVGEAIENIGSGFEYIGQGVGTGISGLGVGIGSGVNNVGLGVYEVGSGLGGGLRNVGSGIQAIGEGAGYAASGSNLQDLLQTLLTGGKGEASTYGLNLNSSSVKTDDASLKSSSNDTGIIPTAKESFSLTNWAKSSISKVGSWIGTKASSLKTKITGNAVKDTSSVVSSASSKSTSSKSTSSKSTSSKSTSLKSPNNALLSSLGIGTYNATTKTYIDSKGQGYSMITPPKNAIVVF